MSTNGEWFPQGPDTMTWWDGTAWTARARLVDGAWVIAPIVPFPTASERSRRNRKTAGILIAALLVVPLVLLVLISVLNDVEGKDTTDRLVAEMNRWELPATVVRAQHADVVDRGNLGSTTPSVTRYFRPAEGVTVNQATRDFIAALRTQGYPDLELHTFDGMPFASGDCQSVDYCDLTIDSYEDGQIIVTLDA